MSTPVFVPVAKSLLPPALLCCKKKDYFRTTLTIDIVRNPNDGLLKSKLKLDNTGNNSKSKPGDSNNPKLKSDDPDHSKSNWQTILAFTIYANSKSMKTSCKKSAVVLHTETCPNFFPESTKTFLSKRREKSKGAYTPWWTECYFRPQADFFYRPHCKIVSWVLNCMPFTGIFSWPGRNHSKKDSSARH